MNFQQLRAVRETTRSGFNLTGVAATLNTSQPGISRQIRELEDELGVDIFVRAGKRLTGLTAPGETVLPIVERLMLDWHDRMDVRVIDVTEQPEVAAQFGVWSLPTTIVLAADRSVAAINQGVASERKLREQIERCQRTGSESTNVQRIDQLTS